MFSAAILKTTGADMRSGGGVLCISALQLVVGLSLLGIYEGYKTQFFTAEAQGDSTTSIAAKNLSFNSPLDYLFYLSVLNNIFAIFGFAGVMNGQKELVTMFFGYNALQMVVSFSIFVDVCVDAKIRFTGEPAGLTPYENAAAAFLFFNFLLSIMASFFALRAIDEIKQKQKEEHTRLSVLSDTLHYDLDNP